MNKPENRIPDAARPAETKQKAYSKKTKIIIIILVLIRLFILAADIIGTPQEPLYDTIYYTDDYPELYKEQLSVIFGKDYQIGEKETFTIEGENCSCGYHSDGYVYDEWPVSYQDQYGQTFTQTIDNMNPLWYQQITWLNEQLRQYYIQNYLIDFFDEGSFEGLSLEKTYKDTCCFITIGNPVHSYRSEQQEEFHRIEQAGENYENQLKERLQEEEHMLHLAEADYENMFDRFPIEVSLHLRMNSASLSGTEKTVFQKAVQERVLEMIQAFRQDTHNTCNLRICVDSNDHCGLYDGSGSWHYYVLQGEPINALPDYDDYEWKFFYSYEGIYW